jgi:hypothetical protein
MLVETMQTLVGKPTILLKIKRLALC